MLERAASRQRCLRRSDVEIDNDTVVGGAVIRNMKRLEKAGETGD